MCSVALNILLTFALHAPAKQIPVKHRNDTQDSTETLVHDLAGNSVDRLLDRVLKKAAFPYVGLDNTILRKPGNPATLPRTRLRPLLPLGINLHSKPSTSSWTRYRQQSLRLAIAGHHLATMLPARKAVLRRLPLAVQASGVDQVASSPAGEKNETSISEPMIDADKVTMQLKAFWEMAAPYFEESKTGRQLFAGVVALTLLKNGISVGFSYTLRDFWSALSDKDAATFQTLLVQFFEVLVFAVPVSVLFRFQREQLAVGWREWMTDRMLQLYNSNRVYYSLERGSEIDNPDQRIAEDVRTFTAFSLSLFITLVTTGIDLVSFSAILYSIQPSLFGTIVAYSLFGTTATTALGRKLVGLNYDKLQKEADFRYALVRLREYAESIAFYAGEDSEGRKIDKRLQNVISNQKEINVAQRNLGFFTNAYFYLIEVLPLAVIAPQYFAGGIPLGVVTQSYGAFNHILDDVSVIIDQFEELTAFSAGIDRLSTFAKIMRDVDIGRPMDSALMKLSNGTSSEEPYMNSKEDDAMIKVELIEKAHTTDASIKKTNVLTTNFSLYTPDRKRLLIKDLHLSLQNGENMLIVGNSGTGKSSFLRAIAGLWTAGSGIIERPSNDDVYFLPQKPYCSLGTLKEQLLYPMIENFDVHDYPEGHKFMRSHVMERSLSDQELLDILKAIDLEQLPSRAGDGDPIKGLEAVLDWSDMLSLGEQQRLAFGRLLINRPRLAILDEATSALDLETEAKMYHLLQDMARNKDIGLTYISVGHRPSLLRYHDLRLRLNGEDNHGLEKIDKSVLASISVGNNM